MSDNKRACETEDGVLENPIKKAKIEVENEQNGVEIKQKFTADNGKDSINNGTHDSEPEKKKQENGISEEGKEGNEAKNEDEEEVKNIEETKKPEKKENGVSEEKASKEDKKEDAEKKKENGITEEKETKEEKKPEAQEEKKEEEKEEVKSQVQEKEPEAPKKSSGEITGELLFAGCCNWDLVGRRKLPKDGKNIGPNLWGPHRIDSMKGVPIRAIFSGPSAAHSVIVNDQGEAFTWGRNDCGQLGQGDMKRREIPTKLDCLDGINIVSASCGKNHTMLLSDTGRVFVMGDNKCGQLGLGNSTPMIPSPTSISNSGPPFIRIAAGGEFSCLVDIKGNLFSFGNPEYGQLGHNTDGKYFVTSNKQAFNYEISPRKVGVFIEKTRDGRVNMIPDVIVKEVFCGPNHTVVIDQKRRLFSWGFGGYGRLGHNEPKDEMVPRHIKMLEGRNIVQCALGNSHCLAHTDQGMLYFWGLAKPTGEATMYPKLVQDLTGWKVRSMGSSHRSIMVAADDSVVAWGPSPTYGELALGEHKKSSTVPTEVKTLNNVYVHKVAMGMGHSLFIARNDTEAERDRLDKMPVFKGV